MKRKILSILLSLAMVFTCIPAMGAAYAADGTITIDGFYRPTAGESYTDYMNELDGVFDVSVTDCDVVNGYCGWYTSNEYTEEVNVFEPGKTYYYAIDLVNRYDIFLGKVEDYVVDFDIYQFDYDSVAINPRNNQQLKITGSYTIPVDKVKISSITTGKTYATVKLSYSKANRAAVDGYQVQVCKNTDFDSTKISKTITDPQATSIKVTGLSKGTWYYVRVRAKVGSTYSKWSSMDQCFTGYDTVTMKNSSLGKTYDVIKKGNYAYVAGKWDIFLVNTSTNKVRTRIPISWDMYESNIKDMAVYSGYLYYSAAVEPFDDNNYCIIGRINLSTGKDTVLKTLEGKTGIKFKVKSSKIYYRYSGLSSSKYYVMSTAGKNVTKKSGKITFTQKSTNATGYKYTSTKLKNTPKRGDTTYKEYLKKSNGKKILMKKTVCDGEGA